jgi:hypothetical protein
VAESWKLTVGDLDYEVEGEILADGGAMFTFTPPLPQREATISVDPGEVEDVVRVLALNIEYDPEVSAFVLALELVAPEDVTPTDDDPDFRTAVEFVPARVVLEMVLDQVVSACPSCGAFEFGDDIKAKNDSKKKLLN